MTGQQTLDGGGHDPLKAGIHRRRAADWHLHIPDWHRANYNRELVGTCRQPNCGGLLQPIDTIEDEPNKLTWYAAACLACGHEVVAPNGRYLARSSRRNEMPDNWWHRRIKALTAQEAARRAAEQLEEAD